MKAPSSWRCYAVFIHWRAVAVVLLGLSALLCPLSVQAANIKPPAVDHVDLAELSLEELMDLPVTSVSKREQPFSQSAAALFVLTQDDIRRSVATSIPRRCEWSLGCRSRKSTAINGRFPRVASTGALPISCWSSIVESEPGQGTAFHLYFPAVEAPVQAYEPDIAPQAVRLNRTCRLLYLDDEEMLVELVRAMFDPQGYQVTGCTKPTEALALVRANPEGFDVVVTDYNMPELSGLEVACEVTKICATLPVVLVSGYLTPAEQASVLAAGVKNMIPKPTMLQELGAVLARLLNSQA